MKSLPSSTYRVQLNSGFTFSDLEDELPYFKKLGISHIYLSPIMEAAEGSTHFYNTHDFTSISSVLGGENGFESLALACSRSGIGLILDIVPNHMSILNRFILDYLKYGRKSQYRYLFDIDLGASEYPGKLILPLLDFYTFQERDRIKIVDGSLLVDDGRIKLPTSTSCSETVKIEDYLAEQNYVLTHWKEAPRIINYRRFFAVSDLIAIRMERRKNFDLFHSKVKDLISRGYIQGIRVDHVDGLYDPLTYLRRLRKLCGKLPIWVEKILARNEKIRNDWPVEGDTGYAARSRINSVFLDQGSLKVLKDLFGRNAGKKYEGEKYRIDLKIEISKHLFHSDIKKYSRLIQNSLLSIKSSGLSVQGISEALIATIASLEQYRTYSSYKTVESEKWLYAVDKANKYFPELSQELAGIRLFVNYASVERKFCNVIRRLEQFTGAVMAKSMEDCFFYRYTALLSTCLVGAMPFEQPYSDTEVHAFFANIQQSGKKPMVTLSTHDSKFGEDAVARFNALSDLLPEWEDLLNRFGGGSEIEQYDEYRILQVILGTLDVSSSEYMDRLGSYIIKALRESGENTNWEYPSLHYEQKCLEFAERSVLEIEDHWKDLLHKIRFLGGLNSLSQTVLKFMVPGVPDTYQGSESMNLSFVDPDNRRPVNFKYLFKRLKGLSLKRPSLTEDSVLSGDLKIWLTSRLLSVRSGFLPHLNKGKYVPIQFTGKNRDKIFGFSYSLENSHMIILVGRHLNSMISGKTYKPEFWNGTNVRGLPGIRGNIRNLITGESVSRFLLEDVLNEYPFAVLVAT
jgi:(1->4)-alpha-D-glucan 1-alpha-D-glucosylmutase